MSNLTARISIFLRDNFSAPMGKVAGSAAAFSAQMNQTAEAAGRMGDALLEGLKAPANEYIDFEAALSRVEALSGETGESLAALKNKALELGSTTSFTSAQAADAMAEFAIAGKDANEIMDLTPSTLSLAKAAGTDLAFTADTLVSTLNAMGDESLSAAQAADIMATTFTSSGTTLESLRESFKTVAPLASQAGISFQDLSAAVGVLGNVNLRGELAGTGLQKVIASFLNPVGQATEGFKALGFSQKQVKELQKSIANGKLPDVLRKVGQAAEGLPDEKRLKALTQIFGLEGIKVGSALITATMDVGSKGFDALRSKLDDTGGAANRVAGIMDRNTKGSLTRLSSAWSGFLIGFGEQMAPAMGKASEALQGLIGAAGEWVAENPRRVEGYAKMAMAATGALLGMKALATGISVVSGIATIAGPMMVGSFNAMRFGVKGLAWAIEGGIGVVKMLRAGELTLASVRAAVATKGIPQLIASLGGFKGLLGKAGLVGLAAAAGYAIGTWINNTFKLSDKLIEYASKVANFFNLEDNKILSDEEKKLNRNIRVSADGTQTDAKTGEVLSLGTDGGAAPKAVREAREAGASTLDEINKFIREQRAKSTGGSGAGAESGQAVGEKESELARQQLEESRRSNRDQQAILREMKDMNRNMQRGAGGLVPRQDVLAGAGL